jgi:hypothetical protein
MNVLWATGTRMATRHVRQWLKSVATPMSLLERLPQRHIHAVLTTYRDAHVLQV